MDNFYIVLTDFENKLRPAINAFLDEILPLVIMFAGVITTIYLGYKVIRSWTGENEKLDAATLLRPCLILAALALYKPLVILLIEKPVEYVNEIVLTGAERATSKPRANFRKEVRDILTFQQNTGGPGGGGVKDLLQVHPVLEFFHLFVFFFAFIAGGYILFKQLIVKTIYLVVGPFALAFSLIVGNERTVISWFQGFFSVLLWLPILSILQTIMMLIPLQDPANAFTGKDIIFSFVLQIVMVLIILKTPQYANILVAQGSSIGQQAGGTLTSMIKNIPQTLIQAGKGGSKSKEKN
ncbi:hypothetical protein [Aquimarina sp. RZ0]|uniref:hypothetical protein n=1 Tax=Aquimarina sp. RZ0 TaxID=2607730 RepID=UPI0011F0A403|nr:hypothetical protein [Aquimarina sp. RZ0]KAA1242584.1 hypothetical protein F0000_25015 [Aquimarina sp. RZ0]